MKPTAVVVADKGASRGIQKWVRRPSKKGLLLIAGVVIGVAVLIGGFAYTRPALKVGSYSYSRGEYKRLIEQAATQKVDEADAKKALTAGLASRSAADSLKVDYPTDIASQNQAAIYKYPDTDEGKISDYQRATAMPLTVEANVRFAQSGGYKAALVYFPFTRYLYGFFPGSNADQIGGDPSLIRNDTAIRKDIAYSKARAKAMREAYLNKSKTIDEIVGEVRSDGALSYGQASNKSRVILTSADGDVETYRGSSGLPNNVLQLILANKDRPGQPSAITEEVLPGPSIPGYSELDRNGGSYVGDYFVVVDKVVKAQKGLYGMYEQKVQELENE